MKLNKIIFLSIFSILLIIFTILIVFLIYKSLKYVRISIKNKKFYSELYYKMKNIYYNSDFVISFVIGNSSFIKHFLSNINIEYSYKISIIDNSNNQDQIKSIIFVEIGELYLISVIKNELIDSDNNLYLDIIKIFYESSKSTKCINNILFIDEALLDKNIRYYEEIKSHVVLINEFLKLNIPLYVIDCSLNKIDYLKLIFSCMQKDEYHQIIGASIDKYHKNSVEIKDILSQIDIIIYNFDILSKYVVDGSKNIYDIVDLMNIKKDFTNILYKSVENYSLFTKLFATNKRPIFRGLFFSCEFIFESKNQFLFVSDLFINKITKEAHILDFGDSNPINNRNKLYEVLIFLYLFFGFLYLIISSTSFSIYTLELKNQYNNIFENFKEIKNSNIIEKKFIINLSNNLKVINININKRNFFNIFYIIESFSINVNLIKHKLNLKVINFLYKYSKKTILTDIRNFFNTDEIIKETKSVNELFDKIKHKFEFYNEIIEEHNKIGIIRNSSRILTDIIKRIYEINNYEINDSICEIDYPIDDFSEINMDLKNRESIANFIVKQTIESLNIETTFDKLKNISEIIKNIITDKQLESKINNIQILNDNYLESLNFKDLENIINYKDCFSIINRLKEINYIDSKTHLLIKNDISEKQKKLINRILNLKNHIIGPIYVYINNVLDFSVFSNELISNIKSLLDNSNYKKYILRKNVIIKNYSNFVYVIKNINQINKDISNYFDYISKINTQTFIGEMFLNIIKSITEKQLLNNIEEFSEKINQEENIRINILMKIINIFESEKDFIEEFINNIYNLKSLEVRELIITIFNKYVNLLFEEFHDINAYKEKNFKNINVNNYTINSIYNINDKDDLKYTLSGNFNKLVKYNDNFNSLIQFIYKYQNKILDDNSIKKIDYLYLTSKSILNQIENKESGRFTILNNFILNIFESKENSKINFNNIIVSDNDYVSFCYKTIYDSMNLCFIKNRNQTIINKIIDVYSLIKKYKNVFPFCIDSFICLKFDELNKIIESFDELYEMALNFSKIDSSSKYEEILLVLSDIKKIKELINLIYDCRIEFIVDENMSSIKDITISYKSNDDKKHKSYEKKLEFKRSLDLNFNLNSSICINLSSLIDNTLNYQPFKNNYMIIDKEIDIYFKDISLFNIIKVSLENCNNQYNLCFCKFMIPIIYEEINYVNTCIDSKVMIVPLNINFEFSEQISILIKHLFDLNRKIIFIKENIFRI